MGAGTIAVIIGILGSIVFAIVGIVYYPLKRALRGRQPDPDATAEEQPSPEPDKVEPAER